MVPNHPRYQLRYTRKLNFEVFLSVVIPVVKAGLRSGPAVRSNLANARAARFSGLCLFFTRIGGATLPNHPRYQLRYTRSSNFEIFLSVVIPVASENITTDAQRSRGMYGYYTLFSRALQETTVHQLNAVRGLPAASQGFHGPKAKPPRARDRSSGRVPASAVDQRDRSSSPGSGAEQR